MFRISFRSLACSTAALALMAMSVSAETPEQVMERMTAKMKAAKSYEYTMTTSTKANGMDMQSKGKMSMVRDGDMSMSRTEMSNTMKMDSMPTPMESSSLMVSDGKTMWTESKQMGQTSVMKMDVPKPVDDKDAVKQMFSEGTAKVLADAEVSGKKCAVIEVTVPDKTDAKAAPTVSTYYYAQDCGMMMKMEMKSPTTNMTMTVSDLKIDASVDKSAFKYTPPAGVAVQDMSGKSDMGAMMGADKKKP